MASLIQWHCHDFNGFTPETLYQALALRDRVFVVEQRSIYGDIDGRDPDCRHLAGYAGDGRLVAYARILAPGVAYPDAAALGRLVVDPSLRGQGVGRQLLARALEEAARLHPGPVMLSAQTRASGFYASFGFVPVGEPYDDGGIEHIDMRKEAD
ncbi:GNAT family N-acetyltransferase [Paludibacterium paludis]|uniref:Acetyltransferase n=1 Tax=Paludibacterium paludis TaxID=1225769 RepID=A0A918P1G7_9NEIS|nr:GNAT family N-acetyltransferase [Paludibacterium paludis]GGY12187.1 acetyltransferase [Paludibacterium paludis]